MGTTVAQQTNKTLALKVKTLADKPTAQPWHTQAAAPQMSCPNLLYCPDNGNSALHLVYLCAQDLQ
jgi:hypothetical protein